MVPTTIRKKKMRRVLITETVYDTATQQFSGRPLSAFVVGPGGIEAVEFGSEYLPTDVTVADPETGAIVGLGDAPLKWAELLPTAFRTGDYTVVTNDHAEAQPEELASTPAPAPELVSTGNAVLDVQEFG